MVCYSTDKFVECNLTRLQEFHGKSIKVLCKRVLLWQWLKGNKIYLVAIWADLVGVCKGCNEEPWM